MSNLICSYPSPAREMSTESFPLQPLEQNGDRDKGNADPGYLQEPLEDATKLGTKNTRKAHSWKDWPWKRILNTVMSLLGYTALSTGISMIAPFYPILVSSTHFLSPPHHPRPLSEKSRRGLGTRLGNSQFGDHTYSTIYGQKVQDF